MKIIDVRKRLQSVADDCNREHAHNVRLYNAAEAITCAQCIAAANYEICEGDYSELVTSILDDLIESFGE